MLGFHPASAPPGGWAAMRPLGAAPGRATMVPGDPGAVFEMPSTAFALPLCLLAVLASSACKVDVDLSGTQFSCSDGVTCPDGTDCVDGLCLERSGDDSDGSVEGEPDAEPRSICDDTFGDAPDYELCAEEDAACVFATRTDGGTCREMCERFGAECLEAFDNDQPPCEPQNADPPDTCDTPRSTEICVCSIP